MLRVYGIARHRYAVQGTLTDATQVNVLHCHTPDTKTPVEETAVAFDQLFKQGKFKKVRNPVTMLIMLG